MVLDLPKMLPVEEVQKMEVDYSVIMDQKIPACKEMAEKGQLTEALEILLSFEKLTRTSADMVSNSRILVAIVQMCFNAKTWDGLNDNIVLLTKRRSVLKQAVSKMVEECCGYVDTISEKDIKLKLIDTLRNVTEGKIYVEVERARLTHKLALMKEEDGDVSGAASIMQELQVETYGSMDRQEKVELILEQMRLILKINDCIRTQIISKKINTKFFESEDPSEHLQNLKLKYYRLMVQMDAQEGNYLNICKHYRAMLTTPRIKNNETERHSILQNVVLYLVLAPYDNEQSDLTHRVLDDKLLNEIPTYKDLLNLFINSELIRWTALCGTFEKELKQGTPKLTSTDVFTPATELGDKRWVDLKNRVVEHNIRIMAKYYTRITLKRMSELLDLPAEEAEEFLSNMVVNKTIIAKTDRPAGIVNFGQRKDPNQILNEWADNLSTLMKLINNTTHLINKEQMLHKHMMAARSGAPAAAAASTTRD